MPHILFDAPTTGSVPPAYKLALSDPLQIFIHSRKRPLRALHPIDHRAGTSGTKLLLLTAKVDITRTEMALRALMRQEIAEVDRVLS